MYLSREPPNHIFPDELSPIENDGWWLPCLYVTMYMNYVYRNKLKYE